MFGLWIVDAEGNISDRARKLILLVVCILGQLSSVKIIFEENIQAVALMSSLPDSWSGLVVSVSESMSKNTLKLDDMKSQELILGDLKRRNMSGISGSSVESSSRGIYKIKTKR